MTGDEPKKGIKGLPKKKKRPQTPVEEQQLSAVEQALLSLQKDGKKAKEYLKTHESRDPHSFEHSILRDDVARAIMADETDIVFRYK